MRITNNMLQRATLAQMQENMRQVADAQRKVSTGLRMERASDDPAAAASTMRARRSLRALGQYQRGIEVAASRATMEESVLGQVTDTLSRVKELATSQVGGNGSPDTRKYVKAEVDELFRHVVFLANTRHEDRYLFGGTDGTTAPFTATSANGTIDYSAAGTTGRQTVEIGDGRLIATNANGTEIFADSGVLASIKRLSDALGANDSPGIIASLRDLDGTISNVQGLLADTGARVNQLQVTRSNLDAMEVNLLTFKSEMEEVDIEAAVTELVGRQTALQAAMVATSRVMGLTLADYLR